MFFIKLIKLKISNLTWKAYFIFFSVIRKNYKIKKTFQVLHLNKSELTKLIVAFNYKNVKKIKNPAKDINTRYFYDEETYNNEGKFNKSSTFIEINKNAKNLINQIIKKRFSKECNVFNSHLKILNMRSWITNQSSRLYGANKWHSDNFKNGIYKIMIYLNPPCIENGTTEFIIDGKKLKLTGPAGTCLLFDNTNILHRGCLPKKKTNRLVIEITLMLSLFSKQINPNILTSNSNCSYPYFPF